MIPLHGYVAVAVTVVDPPLSLARFSRVGRVKKGRREMGFWGVRGTSSNHMQTAIQNKSQEAAMTQAGLVYPLNIEFLKPTLYLRWL